MNRIPTDWIEARRFQAWHLTQQGWSQRQITEALGVSEGAVSQWMTRAREGGADALRHRSPPGARRRLTTEQLAQLLALLERGPEASGFPGATVDPQSDHRRDSAHLWHLVPSPSCRPRMSNDPLEPTKARPPCPPTRRRSDGSVVRGDLACPQKGAQAQQQTILFVGESVFYPLPSVVRTYAPVGHTPIVREWWTRDHLSAIGAISPEGKLYFRSQDCALNADDVLGFLEHLRREVPGRMVIIWDGAPIHRSHTIREFLTHGAAPRLHLERLPAYAPELNPGEGLWQQLKGVELRHVCGVDIPHLRGALRDAVKRVRRKPRILQGCFLGAGL